MNGDRTSGGDGLISGALVENNIIHDNGRGGAAGINMDGVQDSLIRNNLIYNNHATGISAYKIDGAAGPKLLRILNNTVDQAIDGRWCLLLQDTAGPNTIRNNVLLNRNASRGGINYGNAKDVPNGDSDYNIQDWISTTDGKKRVSLSEWQAKGHELHSFSATRTALFVNPDAGDYHLLSNSPAIGKGVVRSDVPFDLEGNPRNSPTAFDIGCYELPI